MSELRGKWTRGIKFELSVACVYCRESGKTLHLLPLKEDQTDDEEVDCCITGEQIHMSYYRKKLLNKSTGKKHKF